MRKEYQKQLDTLHTALIEMGARCEEAISCAVSGLLDADTQLCERAVSLEKLIDLSEHEIDFHCMELLLKQQPVAKDFRQILAAQHMVRDMERIGDQAADIAMLASSFYLDYDRDDAGTRSVRELLKHRIPIRDMAKAAATMLTMSMDSFVTANLDKAREAIKMDDVVDDLFRKVKQELLDMITHDHQNSGICLDVLMIAKYLERIGDHSVNIAERVVYSITGDRNDAV